MRARHISTGCGAWIPVLAVVLAATVGLPAAVSAQGTGTLSGIVTVDEGEVQLTAWGWLDSVTPGETGAMRDFVEDHRANTLDAESRGESCGSGAGA